MSISYDTRQLRSIANSDTGEVGSDTVFHYHQDRDVVWTAYEGVRRFVSGPSGHIIDARI